MRTYRSIVLRKFPSLLGESIMTLTNDQLQLAKMIVSDRMGGKPDSISFVIDADNCSNEEIDLFDALCQNPERETSLGNSLWIKVKYSVINEQYEITAGEYW